MRDYFKRVATGLFWMAAIITVCTIWIVVPGYIIAKYAESLNWIGVVCIAWMIIFPIFIISALDDGKPMPLIPPAPPRPKTHLPKPQNRGRMGQ